MPTDPEIARRAVPRPIAEVAEELGLAPSEWRPHGWDVAKLDPALLRGHFGMKGGGTGGGRARLVPSERIDTRLALHVADWTITEAGFGFDLGAEKFFDIKCRSAGLDTHAVVLVATVRALKLHGGAPLRELEKPDADAVRRGLPNLDKHVENICHFGETPVVALNRFAGDGEEEIAPVRERCRELGVPFAVSDHFARGGEGALELARVVRQHASGPNTPFLPLYRLEDPLPEKVRAVARAMYGADGVVFTREAERDLRDVRRLGYESLPVCIAKTPASLSDDPTRRGRPEGFDVTVRSIQIHAGAGFLVVLTGDILRMPGLPRRPLAEGIDLREGEIVGLT